MKGYANPQKMSVEQPFRPHLPLVQSLLASSETHGASASKEAAISVRAFVEKVFIPTLVELKNGASPVHYFSILKYILTPESVDLMSSVHGTGGRGRLRSKTNWPYLDDVRVRDLTADRIRQIISCASNEGYSPQTLKHIRTVIGTIIKVAKRERILNGENPISRVELPTMTRRELRGLTVEQVKTILKVMKYPEREVALLTICTGLGVSEICALRWKNVNLTHAPIFRNGVRVPARSIIIGKLARSNTFKPVQQGPNKHVAISETLGAALMKLRQRHGSEDPNDFLVTSPDGGPQSPLNRRLLRLKPISKELQISWLSWQVLKRAHQGLLEELRISLTDQLVAHAYWHLS